jgi:arabinose-5-phosphate isomerase
MTGNPDSALALASDAHLDTGVETEACPLDLAPTSSTTTALVMGDALAIALLEARGFTAEDFAFSHPGGKLGRKLLLKVADVMREGYAIPRVNSATKLIDALLEISQKGLGMTTVIDQDDVLLGLFTDGDLRRTLDKGLDVTSTPIREVMTTGAKTIGANHLAAEALNIMEQNKISALVVAEGNSVRGVIHLMDLLREGIA